MHKMIHLAEISRKLLLMILVCTSYLGGSVFAQETQQQDVDVLQIKKHAEYSEKGADTCLKCHDEDSDYPVMDIFRTPHGSTADKHSPFAQQQCESCHGPVGKHDKNRIRKGESREPMIAFDKHSQVPVAERNAICASCHEKVDQSHWQGSIHQVSDVACSDCHTVHAVNDPIQFNITQIEKCGSCHQSHKLSSNRFSTHPLKTGQMGCTSCHNLHQSDHEKLLNSETVNDTCFSCHAEKRGPYLWEHEPATEDCGLCHAPHGSNQSEMLTQRSPYLCQSCHSSQGHPSLANDDSGLIERRFPALRTGSAFLLGRACGNCHSKVHGSNHPSGSKLQR